MGGTAFAAAFAAALPALQEPASVPASWPLEAWLGVGLYLCGFLLVAWIVWRIAGPEVEDSDDLGN